MARQVGRAELARMAGVSKAALTKLTRAGGKLATALDGDWIDLDHPATVEWLRGKGVKPTAARPPRQKRRERPLSDRPPAPRQPAPRRAPPASPETPSEPEAEPAVRFRRVTSPESAREYLSALGQGLDIEDLPGMTLQELIERFGTESRFRDWLDARKRVAEIIEKDLKNEETTGRLIDRELVRTHVFGHIDATNKQLLGDAATNVARTVYGMARSGDAVENAERMTREILGGHLNTLKTSAAKAIRNA